MSLYLITTSTKHLIALKSLDIVLNYVLDYVFFLAGHTRRCNRGDY